MAALRIYIYSVTGIIFFIARPGSSLFSWHPTLMSLGSMLMIYEGIVLLNPKKSLLDGANFTTKRNVHSILQITGLIVMLLGATAVYMHKVNLNKPHFSTLHSLFGVAAGVLGVFQAIGGLGTRFPSLSPLSPKYMKLGHSINGLFQYFFICLAFMAGIFSNYMTERTTPFIQLVLISLPMIAFATSYTRLMNRFLLRVLKPK